MHSGAKQQCSWDKLACIADALAVALQVQS